MSFKQIEPSALVLSPFETIGNEWMLITAGDERGINTMTASWGGMGVVWGHDAVTVYIRPQRFTKKFVDEQQKFSLCFFDGHKKELGMLGAVSGRDKNKIADAGFTPVFLDGVPAFEQARLVIVAEKMYSAPFEPERFIDRDIPGKIYPTDDLHTMYIAKVCGIYNNND